MFKPKKMFGQNFLIDGNVVAKIVRVAGLSINDEVWEIGAGKGVLTAELLKTGCSLTCFEIDRDLITLLRKQFGQEITLIAEDVLKADWDKIFQRMREKKEDNPKVTIVANIPYYITSPLLYKITDYAQYFAKIIIMLQREFAERLTAKPGSKSYGVMSLRIQYFFEVQKVFRVPRHLFRPEPAVDSEVVKLVPREKREQFTEPDLFWKLIETAFHSRRKTLKNNLSTILSKEELQTLSGLIAIHSSDEKHETVITLDKPLKFDLRDRGESLDEKDFINLYRLVRHARKLNN